MTADEAYRLPGSGVQWTEDYEKGRPGWPAGVFTHLDIPAEATVLEVGAGTGKLTRLLKTRFARVLAVEPQAAMRAQLVRLVPGVETFDATSERLPLEDSTVDAVFAAEAFHKFDGAASVREFARVLRPGGCSAMMWNVPAAPVSPSIDAVDRLIDSLLVEHDLAGKLDHQPTDLHPKTVQSGVWRRAFENSPFETLREERLSHEDVVDPTALTAFLASMGWMADLHGSERESALGRITSLLTAPQYRRSWTTHLYWTRLRAEPRAKQRFHGR
jgi:SAM-dependent methyltransferase